MKPITFCIPTARNERDYVSLLLTSIIQNTQHHLHEILVFVDTDNQNTHEMLLEFKKTLPNLKIYRNEGEFQVGGQRNISIMFNAAKNDIVCYLQSDMVVSPNFDKHLVETLISENQILCFTRIEPPLHPASPEKIVMNFGLDPSEFRYEEFLSFAKSIELENRPSTLEHFAPFAVFKKTWIDVLGGYDTQFRCSREDSDLILRATLNNIEMIQTWKAFVYHFTCVSSRGHEWFKQNKSKDSELTLNIQTLADREELKRYIRKWGFFGHTPQPMYDVTFFVKLDNVVQFDVLKFLETHSTKLFINDETVVKHLREQIQFDAHYYSNFRWKYSHTHWEKVKHLFNPTDWETKIQYKSTCDVKTGTVVEFNFSSLNNLQSNDISSLFENIQVVIDQNEVGKYQLNDITLTIFDKINLSDSMKKTKNIDLLLNEREFLFI